MFTKKGSKYSYLIYMVKHNTTLISFSLFLFCFLFLFYTVSNYNGVFYYGNRYCLADAYVWFLMPRAYGILIMPFIVIIYINFTKYEEMPSILLRLGTIEEWLKRKVIVGIVLSSVIAMIAMIVVTAVTSIQVATVINWDKGQSIYYAMTQHTNPEIQIGQVMLIAFLTIFLRNFILCLGIIFLTLKFHNHILTFLIISGITVGEIIQKKIPLFYHYITMDYALWEEQGRVISYTIYFIIAILFLAISIKRCSKKQEWIHEK